MAKRKKKSETKKSKTKSKTKRKPQHRPRKKPEAAQRITINAAGRAAPPDQKIGNQDTLTFENKAGCDATITFLGAGAGEFRYNGSPVTSATIYSDKDLGPLTPIQLNVTVDYRIDLASGKSAVFSVAVGAGPLEIEIVDVAGDVVPAYASIANSGSIFFHNQTQEDAEITFTGDKALFDAAGNPVSSPQPVKATMDSAIFTGKGTKKRVDYHVAMLKGLAISGEVEVLLESRSLARGNGTIKVGQT